MLRAFDADNLSNELWNSNNNSSRDNTGNFPKYSPPTVANGKVYLGSFSRQLNVYGLLNTSPDLTIQVSPTTISVLQNASVQATVAVGYLNGLTGSTTLSVSGVPSGVSATVTPASVTASGTATLTATAGSTPQFGTATLTVTAINGALSRTSSVTLSVLGPAPTGLTATPNGSSVGLAWSPPSGGPAISKYNVYRSTTSGFLPSPTSLISSPSTTTFVDSLIAVGTGVLLSGARR